MNMNASNLPPGDPKLVTEIVNKVKAEGLFDKFRKDCLADVDTKPAYQNLTQRVEKYVSRFLSSQKWTPTLNKKQLRDNLRKQINQSGMLAKGVERIVEQVVDPKINTVIKPEVEKVVSQYLGINHEDRLERLKLQASHERSDFRSPDHHSDMSPPTGKFGNPFGANRFSSPPSLFNMPNVNVPPPMFGSPQQPPPQMNAMFPPPMFPDTSMYPPGNPMIPPPGNPMFPPNFGFPSMNYTNMGPGPAPPFGGNFAPITSMPNAPGFPSFPMPPTEQPMEDASSTLESEDKNKKDAKIKVEEEKPKMDTAQLLDSLLNIPLPKVDPTNDSPTKQFKGDGTGKKSVKKVEICEEVTTPDTEEEKDVDILSENSPGVVEEEEITVEEIPLPGISMSEIPLPSDMVPTMHDDIGEGNSEGEKPSKVYHFAWDDIQDRLSELSVSSVHTSDLSSFEDSDSEIEDPDESEEASVASESQEEEETEAENSQATDGTPISSPVKAPKEEVAIEKEKKPRRLVSLNYNISDGDEDETREERKARMAKEKEDRYLQRQQRRAEIEAKRKEVKPPEKKPKAAEQAETESEEDTAEQQTESAKSEAEEKEEVKEVAETKKPEPKSRRSKQELKEKKVLEKRMALRRQRTRNKRYTSADFTSIFTDKHQLLSEGYGEVIVEEQVIESGGVEGSDAYVDQGADVYEKEPGTPTQDEVEYDNDILVTETSNIPIYEVPLPSSNSAITIGQLVYNTRSAGRRKSDGKGSRPSTPFSETSEASKTDSVDVKVSKGVKSPVETSPADSRPRSQQRYETSDLYKPRVSRRRASPTSSSSSYLDNTESGSKSQRVTSPGGSSIQSERHARSRSRSRSRDGSSRSKSRSKSRSRSRSRSRSKSRSVSPESHRKSGSSSPERRPRTPADELSFGEAEKRHHSSGYQTRYHQQGRETGKAYNTEPERRQRQMRDQFGEAERRTRRLSNRLFHANKTFGRGRSPWKPGNSPRARSHSGDQASFSKDKPYTSRGKEQYQEPSPARGPRTPPGGEGAEHSEGEIVSDDENMTNSPRSPRPETSRQKGPRTPPPETSPTRGPRTPEPERTTGPKTPPSEPSASPQEPRTPSPAAYQSTPTPAPRHYTPPRTRGHDRVVAEQHEPSPPHTRFRGRAPPQSAATHKYSPPPPPARDTRRSRAISPPQSTGRTLRKRSCDEPASNAGSKRLRH